MGFEWIGFRAFLPMAAVAAMAVLLPQDSIAQQPGHPAAPRPAAPRPAPPPAPPRPVYRPNVSVQRPPSVVQQARPPAANVVRPPPSVVQQARPPAANVVRPVPPVVNRPPSVVQQARPPAANVVRPVPPVVTPNAGINRVQPLQAPAIANPFPFGGQPHMPAGPVTPAPHIAPGLNPPPHNVVVGPGNGLRLGPGRPVGPPGVHLAPGPGGFAHRPPPFPVVTVGNRFFPIVRGPRFVWWGGYRRAFVPLAVLGIAAIGGSYWYPDGYVSVAQPYCTGLTPDGCQLTWRMVDFDGGGAAPQCVQYCPQVGPLPVPGPGQAPARVASLPPPPPPAPADGTCQMTIFAEPNFAGAAAPTTEAQAALGEAGWLNEISSVQVQSGEWEFYPEENFGGVSMRLDPGDYPNLAPEWTKHIGSFQCVQPT